jgi:tetratricopeptide (TPR) repeat protein
MEPRVTEQFEKSFVRVSTADGTPVGAGFLVSERHLLTCAHVVAAAVGDYELGDDAERPQGTVHLDFLFFDKSKRIARVEHWWPRTGASTNPSGDIAILKLASDLPRGAEPTPPTKADAIDLFGHEFKALGFPAGDDQGVWAYGEMRNRLGNGWLQVESAEKAGRRIEPGFSGGPVGDLETGAIVGMVVAVTRESIGFVIPTQVLADTWPDLRVVEVGRIRLADIARPLPETICNVPYARNPFFTGRTEILDGIRGALEATSTIAVTQAISGLGGIGKTQTTVEYAYRYRDNYEAIFWVIADNEATITSAYAEIARLLNLPEAMSLDQNRIVETVRHWFETHDKWLLIMDNADTPSLVRRFLPLSPLGHILITSRAQNLDMLGIPRALDLQELSPDEALEFLLKRTGREDTDVPERQAAANLAEELGWLPLALEQAGAYIAAHQARFEDYLVSFERRQLELLEASPPIVGDYPRSVSTTWSLNFDEIDQVNAAAADLLRVSTFLSPDSIPLELITEGASETGRALSAALAQVQEDPVVMNTVLEPLIRYSLIRRDIESNTYSVHRLVQDTVKTAMDDESRRIWALRAVRAINFVFPSASYATWPLCDRLLPHSVKAAKLVDDFDFQYADSGNFLNGVASYLRMIGDFGEAERLHLQGLAIAERDLGPDDPSVATHLNNLALVYIDQYMYSKAEPLLVHALNISENAHGADNSELALPYNNLGTFYVRWSQYAEARPLLQKAQPLLEKALELEKNSSEPEEFFYALILNNMAELYLGFGDYDKAELLCRTGLEIRERVDNPEKTGLSYITLASILLKKGEYDRSEEYFKLALANRETVYGSDHPELIKTLERYIEFLNTIGRDEEATQMQQRIEAIRAKHFIRNAY